ncbi:hypothetical protein GY21_21210 [Cryobacterium roopkundense]|uniref:Resolvase HTH domain-containing protein n=1 Tax=Cryobacterium roopkundense TaxID=1001240 RepID=A0A099IZH8_9MICO|nr:hypothetical protein GY21_21210 [Cryobacterium roopkundense]
MTPAKIRLAIAAVGRSETKVGELCEELGITRQTLYRHVSPAGGPAARWGETTFQEIEPRPRVGLLDMRIATPCHVLEGGQITRCFRSTRQAEDLTFMS